MKSKQLYVVQFIGDHWAKGIKGQYRKEGGGCTTDISKADLVVKTKAVPWDEPRDVWDHNGTTGEMWVAHKLIPAEEVGR